MNGPLLSRRDWLSSSGALLAIAALGNPRPSTGVLVPEKLLLNSRGGYRFLPGVRFLSFGARAADGFEIVRTTFRQARPFPAALADIQRLLRAAGRPIHALCGLELRSPRPLSRTEFDEFNAAYIARLQEAELLLGDQVPVTRTNVAFARANDVLEKPEVSVHAFCHTMPTGGEHAATPTFVLAGIPEIRNLQGASLRRERPAIVAGNDTTAAGLPTLAALRLKTEFILSALDETMRTLGVHWTDVTGVQLYTMHDVQPLLADLILPRIGDAARLGIEWHHARPPGVEMELGVRGIRVESNA